MPLKSYSERFKRVTATFYESTKSTSGRRLR